ncbi:MAG: Spy/CpxP family protein refolding chaperone [Proteobacteria bacterium]|nr:Spy/CpxP family protein refolding chaperone [Pseudomonadota bacterium]
MLKKYAAVICVPILLMCVAFLAGCQRPTPERMVDRITEKLKSKLELNAAQQEQLDGIKEELKKKMAEMKKNHASKKEEFLTLLQSDTIDQEKLKKMINEKKARMDEFSSLMIDKLVKFHSTLSPEQKEKLVKYLRERHDCMN